jgi:toluene monooxygenase system ferredoxin subunit
MAFVRIAAVDDLWSGEMRGYVIRGKKVLLVRVEDSIYAYENRCVHQGVPLSQGSLEGCVLTCSAHHWQYDICTGAGVNPASVRLKPVPVEVRGEEISVDVCEVTL